MKAAALANKLSDKLAQITTANGFRTNIGERVYRGRRNLDTTNIPCVTIYEGEDRVEGEAMREVTISQLYVLEGHAACDVNHPNDRAHEIIADLKEALFKGVTVTTRPLDGLAKKLTYKNRIISPREDGQAFITGAVIIEVFFVEDLTSP